MRLLVIALSGEYDLALRDQFRYELEQVIDEPNPILDFTNVTFFDSTCVGELIRFRKLRMKKGYPPETLIVSTDPTKKLFAILRMGYLFRLAERLEDAVGTSRETPIVRAVRGAESAIAY